MCTLVCELNFKMPSSSNEDGAVTESFICYYSTYKVHVENTAQVYIQLRYLLTTFTYIIIQQASLQRYHLLLNIRAKCYNYKNTLLNHLN